MTIFWLIAFFVFAVGEAGTVGLVSVWFAVGALAAMFATALGAGLWLQVTVFLGISALALALFKPLSSKILKPRVSATNADRVIGGVARVTEAVNNEKASGAVYVDGKTWTARSTDGSVIPAGEQVLVRKIEGVKLLVDQVRTEALK